MEGFGGEFTLGVPASQLVVARHELFKRDGFFGSNTFFGKVKHLLRQRIRFSIITIAKIDHSLERQCPLTGNHQILNGIQDPWPELNTP